MKFRIAGVVVAVFSLMLSMAAQNPGATPAAAQVPPVIQFSNVATSEAGNPLTGTVEITFSLYNNSQGGEPLWAETQNVSLEDSGHYSVYVGISKRNGVPMSLFTGGQAHWLGVQIAGQAEQPRVFLVSVPYAIKAGDAATIGGLPPSAFVLAAPPSSGAMTATADGAAATPAAGSASPAASSDVTTTGGTANAIPLFSTATNIQNSIVTQTGKSAINVGGKLNLFATGTATASGGKNSQPQDFVALVFNSTTSTAVPQTFQLQAEPAGNGTTTASGTLNLLYASGTATPAETGVKISSKGLLTFATGQTFPGTVTGLTAGTDLTVGGTSSNPTLNLNTTATDARYARLDADDEFNNTTYMTGSNVNGVLQVASNAGSLNFGAIVGTSIATSGNAIFGKATASTGSGVGVNGSGPSVPALGSTTAS